MGRGDWQGPRSEALLPPGQGLLRRGIFTVGGDSLILVFIKCLPAALKIEW